MARFYNLKRQVEKPERLTGGHRLCAGCGAGIVVSGVLRALEKEDRAVIVNATGCLEVSTYMYPYTAYTDSYIHSAFENAAATCSGAEAAYRALKRRGKVEGTVKFIAFGGDGGTYDIGFQSLSGAMERGHDMVYVCYDNEAYMNTGIQRSSSTPRFARTTTSRSGSRAAGQKGRIKGIEARSWPRHHIPYLAADRPIVISRTCTPSPIRRFIRKAPAFLTFYLPVRAGGTIPWKSFRRL
jgi:pyruvate ferredoxin oxidoreductase beta subunit